jgi:CheY-like chemotaxis protein
LKHGILVVEDNQLNRELLCDWLEMENYEVWFAANLEATYEVLAKRLPDAVLLDINLGAENGLDLIAWMRQKTGIGGHSRDCRDGTCSSDGPGTDPSGRLQSLPLETDQF